VNQFADGALIEDSIIKGNNTSQSNGGGGIVIFDADRMTVRGNDIGFNNVADVAVGGDDNVIVDNLIPCPTSIVLGGANNTYAPVNVSDPHTNLAHAAAC
jgi:parallel beta-helix repeat protein